MPPLLVVGLGNPGDRYKNTRHNIGFQVIRKVADKLSMTFKTDKKFQGEVAKTKAAFEGGEEREVIFLLPTTYMNLSGSSVASMARYLRILAPEVLVVADEVDIPFGTLKVAMRGSPGTHNGLKDIAAKLGTREFPRLKVGIGDRLYGTLESHVLGNFTEEEQALLPDFIDKAADAVMSLLTTDIHKVMTAVNYRKKNEPTKNEPL
ncbi:MAG: aminoacyl-tRNA hydrolase [Chlamydiia bacterium]|nr:aminoacyl-tRNA hydrolase [Chlamydiia bacterium]